MRTIARELLGIAKGIIAGGTGVQLSVGQVVGILKANGLRPNAFDEAPISVSGLKEVATVTLPTKARLVRERTMRGEQVSKGTYFLRVGERDTKDWIAAYEQHVKEAGGLGGGYNIRFMV